MQALYAYLQTDDKNMAKAEKSLLLSLERLYDLYIYFLYFPVLLKQAAERRIEEAKHKKLPLEEDLNPNIRFVENRLITLLEQDEKLNKLVENRGLNQQVDMEEVKIFFNKTVRPSKDYIDYMAVEKSSLEDDIKFFIHLYRNVLPKAEVILNYFVEKSVYWDTNDIDYALSNVIKTFKYCLDEKKFSFLPLYKDEKEDVFFAKTLFKRAIKFNDEYEKAIIGKAQNWEEDRIASLDLLLMKMAITEFTQFPSIPIKVSLNEYIELSKWYSSPKSKIFINGILDKIVVEYKSKGLIKKMGRGLLEN